jgi:hypothetical protein
MAGPDDRGGFQISLPDAAAMRQMRVLVAAILSGNEEEQEAVLASADLRYLALAAAVTVAACLTATVRRDSDPDSVPAMLTDEELHHAMAILVTGITGPDDDNSTGRT